MLGWIAGTRLSNVPPPPGKRRLLLKRKLIANNNRDRAAMAEKWKASAIRAFGFDEVIQGLPWDSKCLESLDYLAFLYENFYRDGDRECGIMTNMDVRTNILKMLDDGDISLSHGFVGLLEHIANVYKCVD